MHFESAQGKYEKGMLLEAARLNADFALEHFLLRESATGRLSRGIIAGLPVRVRNGSLVLEPGVFKLNDRLGWLDKPLPVAPPPLGQPQRLWLKADPQKESGWFLSWLPDRDEPEDGICLCRMLLKAETEMRDSWLFTQNGELDLASWENRVRNMNVDYVHLEYAMAASHAPQPTLLPAIQHKLAACCNTPELKLWLLNGLLPLLDYYGKDWKNSLDALCRQMHGQPAEAAPRTKPRNIAG